MNAIVPFIPGPAPMTISDVERVALAIAKGGLFGSKDPNAVLTLCLLAQAEGQHPAVVFRDYHIISGKPAKKAEAMLRDFITAGGKVKWHALDDEKADATFTHPSGEARIDWTLERARQAGITTPMWKKYPRQMLRSRVISEGVRTVYPGATSGLYEVGEVQDMAPERAAETETRAIEHRPVADMGDDAGQGHSQEGAVSPDQQQTKRPKPLQGPIKTRAEIRIKYGEFIHDLHGCGDADMLDIVLNDNKAFIDQVEDELPAYWKGDGADFLGLEKEIERAKAHHDEAWRMNPVRAG